MKMTIHLYELALRDQGILRAMCGEEDISPGVNAFCVRKNLPYVPNITLCEKCKESDDFAMWTLATVGS